MQLNVFLTWSSWYFAPLTVNYPVLTYLGVGIFLICSVQVGHIVLSSCGMVGVQCLTRLCKNMRYLICWKCLLDPFLANSGDPPFLSHFNLQKANVSLNINLHISHLVNQLLHVRCPNPLAHNIPVKNCPVPTLDPPHS